MRSGILLMALSVPALSHWVQDLELYEAPPGSGDIGKKAGEAWGGCVLKTCKNPSKFQNKCPEQDDQATLIGTELAQDAVFASNLGEKATAVAAYMATHSKKFKQEVKAIWANNGKGLLLGFPGNRPEIIEPGNAKDYKVFKAKFQQETECQAGQRLGELRMAVTLQNFIGSDGNTVGGADHEKTSVPLLRIKVENRQLDCGVDVEKGFYLRIDHTGNPGSDAPAQGDKKGDPPKTDKKCGKKVGEVGGADKWDHTFEFTGRKALPTGSTGSFDVLLTNLQLGSSSDKYHWPCEVKITIVSPCREELAYLHLTPPDSSNEVIVAPSWLGSFWR